MGMAWLGVCVLILVTATATASEGAKSTRVKVYFHDTSLFRNESRNTAALTSKLSKSATWFGRMFVFDDVLTEGPSMRSRQVGYAQGLYAFSGRTNFSAFWAATAFLGDRGSISFMGAEIIVNDALRSLPVVGGTGSFANSRGLVDIRNIKLKPPHYFSVSLDFNLWSY